MPEPDKDNAVTPNRAGRLEERIRTSRIASPGGVTHSPRGRSAACHPNLRATKTGSRRRMHRPFRHSGGGISN